MEPRHSGDGDGKLREAQICTGIARTVRAKMATMRARIKNAWPALPAPRARARSDRRPGSRPAASDATGPAGCALGADWFPPNAAPRQASVLPIQPDRIRRRRWRRQRKAARANSGAPEPLRALSPRTASIWEEILRALGAAPVRKTTAHGDELQPHPCADKMR